MQKAFRTLFVRCNRTERSQINGRAAGPQTRGSGRSFGRSFSSTTQNQETQIHPLFKHSEVSPNVFFIQEKYFVSWNLANIFFIKGANRDLLVDTGIGIYSLPSYLKASGLRPDSDKPVDVVLTHAHFDHSGGAHQFDKVHVHEAEAKYISTGDRRMTAAWVTGREIVPKPCPAWDPTTYRVKPASVQPITDSFEFALGDRVFKVVHLPGHTPGSIGLIDDHGVLVTGDTLYGTTHGLIDWYPKSNCARMRSSVEKLIDLCKRQEVETVLPGHNQVLSAEEAIRTGEDYIAASGANRSWRKGFSRLRANTFLSLNQIVPLPEPFREAISN